MAVQIFKGGVCTYVEPHSLQNHLNAGWSLTDGVQPEPKHPDYILTKSIQTVDPKVAEREMLIQMGILKADGTINHLEPSQGTRRRKSAEVA